MPVVTEMMRSLGDEADQGAVVAGGTETGPRRGVEVAARTSGGTDETEAGAGTGRRGASDPGVEFVIVTGIGTGSEVVVGRADETLRGSDDLRC